MTTGVVFKSSKGRKEHLNQSWLKFSLCYWECKQKKKPKGPVGLLSNTICSNCWLLCCRTWLYFAEYQAIDMKTHFFFSWCGYILDLTHYAACMSSFPLKTVCKSVRRKTKTRVPVNIFERAQEIQVRITGGALSLWRGWGTVMTDTSGAFHHTPNLTHYAHLVALGNSFHIKRCNVKALRRTGVWLMRRARGRVQVVVYPCHGRKARMQRMDG